MPLLYNPNSAQSNDYFSKNDIYSGNVTEPDYSLPTLHWDVMRFNGADGTCLFNNIYGVYDFNASGSFNINYEASKQFNSITGKQQAYLSGGEAADFVQDPSGNIAVVGYCRDETGFFQAAIIKMDVNGYVLSQRFISKTPSVHNTARAIEYAVIGNVPCYIVGDTADFGNRVDVYAIPTNFAANSSITLLKTFTPDHGSTTVFGFSVQNNILVIPLLKNNDYSIFYSGNNVADLELIRLDLNSNTILSTTFLSQVAAFDLKAKTTILANGDIGVVSSKITQPWLTQYGNGNTSTCLTAFNASGQAPCSYMLEFGCSNLQNQTPWWNSDTYVARVSNTTGAKIWETTFDASSPAGCSDFPTSTSSGGGDPKHQECMYGISEAPDGGIVVSGNMSANYDDNYMAKIKGDCNSNVNYTFDSYTQNTFSTTQYWDAAGTNPWGVTSGSIKIRNELRIAAGATVQATDMIFEFAPNAILVLEPGAKLKLEGCTLTGSIQCNTMWQGISMLGTYGVNQHAQNSYLELLDNNGVHSTIKNAIVGISNNDETNQSNPGGKIYAVNAIFENNKVAASFVEDGHGNTIVPQCPNGCRNVFWNCEFKMTAAKLLSPYQNIGVETGISLNNVHDVDIESSTPGATKFIGFNSTTSRMNKAIESIDAEFEVSKITFTNCNYGINCESSVGATYSPHFFTENTFNNCYYGIRMRNGLNDHISDNSFNPNAAAYSRQKASTLPNKYGVFLDASSGTKILGNTFTNLEYGLTIVNSGANGAFVSRGIYGNASIFTNCFRGLNTLGNNSKVSVKCTNFSSNTSALGFGAHWYISGQLKNQGLAGNGQPNSGSPAGNTFQHNSGIDIIAVKNTANFKYYYKINSSGETPTIAGLATIIPVNGIAVCNSPELMVLAGNEPALAEQLISNETDDELKAIYVSQLSFWYENQGREQERIALLIAQNEEYANEQLLPLLMEREEYQAAMDLLQDYLGTGNSENDDYYTVNAMQLEWALNSKTAFDMTSSEEATLRDIAEHFTRAAASARVILNQVFKDQYEAPFYSDSSERKANFEEEIIAEQNGSIAGIAPNPANNEAIISYKLFEGIETAELQIWNMTGQLVKKITLNSNETQLKFDTKQLVGTIYIIKLICNSVLIDKQKLVIQH